MLYIDGNWCEAENGNRFSITNPATGQPIGEVAAGGERDARRAIDAAHGALES